MARGSSACRRANASNCAVRRDPRSTAASAFLSRAESLRIRRGIAAGEIEIGADDLQEIVEIVRHAARQMPDRLHLLRLAQRLFGAHARGDVGDRDQEAVIRNGGGIDVEIAVGDDDPARAVASVAVEQIGRKKLRRALRLVSAEALERRADLGQRRGQTRELEECGIERRERLIGFEHGDAVADAVECRLQDLRLLAAFGFRLSKPHIAAHQQPHGGAKNREHEQRAEKRSDERRAFERFGVGRARDQEMIFFRRRGIEQAVDMVELHDDDGDQPSQGGVLRQLLFARAVRSPAAEVP